MSAPAETERDSGQEQRTGWYVYGIVPADVEVASDAQGVGDPPGRVRIVRQGDVSALVSEVDLSRPLGRPDDLVAHESLLDATAGEVPVLPMRFGSVVADEKAVADELLAPHQDEFAAALAELEGKAEFVLRGRYVEEAVLREILSENPRAAELREAIADQDEDLTRGARIQLGEIVNNEITARREADTRAVGQAVEGACVASVVRDPTNEEDAVYVALLVDSRQRRALEKAVADLAEEWKGRVDLRLLGPLAPYDFVATIQPEQ